MLADAHTVLEKLLLALVGHGVIPEGNELFDNIVKLTDEQLEGVRGALVGDVMVIIYFIN